jgi:hypothetical protein
LNKKEKRKKITLKVLKRSLERLLGTNKKALDTFEIYFCPRTSLYALALKISCAYIQQSKRVKQKMFECYGRLMTRIFSL